MLMSHFHACCANLFLFIIFGLAVANDIALELSKTSGYVVNPTYLLYVLKHVLETLELEGNNLESSY